MNVGIQLLSIPEGLVISSVNHRDLTGTSGGISNTYPNPFSEYTTIEYHVGAFSTVEIEVFNIWGQKVKNLDRETHIPGSYSVVWDGKGENSSPLPNGIYFVRLKLYTNTGLQTLTRQVQIVR